MTSTRGSAIVIALVVLGASSLTVRALARGVRERRLADERHRAETLGTRLVTQLAEGIGRFVAETEALAAVAEPSGFTKPAAGSEKGHQTWLVGDSGRLVAPARDSTFPILSTSLLRRVARTAGTERTALLGPLPSAAGGELILAVASIGRRAMGGPRTWLVRGAELRDIAGQVDFEQLLAAGYDYDILIADSNSAPRRGLRGAGVVRLAPVRLPLGLGTSVVELALAPRDGWATTRTPDLPLAFGLLLSVVLAIAIFEWARVPDRVRREANDRLSQLEGANRQLLATVRGYQERDRNAEAELSRDVVTGLPSRAYFVGRVERALSRVRAVPGSGFAVLSVGIEGVRYLADSVGPEAGDRLLTAMALPLDRAMRPGDTVARVGDDAFGLLLYDVATPEAATGAARRIRQVLDEAAAGESRTVSAATWIGIEVSRSGYERADEMLRHAEMAMGQAKTEGVGGTALFDPALREQAAQRFQLESDLRVALERDELRVVYQVVVCLETRAIKGAEALIRWAHPLEGLIPPVRFIGLAEETGLIVPITRWVLRRACLQLAEWRDAGLSDFYVSVNLSARDLQDPTLCAFLRDLMHETGVTPGALRVEVTEGMLMADLRAAEEVIEGLRRLRVPILLDDFGTGYSSLSYLHRFRLDVLKIDRAFVRDIATNDRTRNIAGTIVHLAADLGMRTIAEGIDDAGQIDILRALGCDFGQGYHFGKPVEAGSIAGSLGAAVG